MKKIRSAISLVVIAFLGITSLICAKGILEGLAARSAESWLSDQPSIYTTQLTDDQKDALVSTLQELSGERGFIAVSRDKESLQSGATLYTFSVLATPGTGNASPDPLTLLDTTVIDDSLLRAVIDAGPDGYAGYGNDALSRVASLPSIRSGLYFRIDRLDSGANLGSTCTFVGLSDSESQTLVDDLSSTIGVSAETLTTRMSGSTTELGLLYWFCAGAFILLAIVLCLLMVTHSLLELKTLGVHLMLGWSRGDFACELLGAQARQLPVVLPIGALGTLAILEGFALRPAVVGFALASVLPAVVAVLVAAVISIVPLFTARPVEAICGRYSRRGFYALAMAVYLLCMVAIFGGCLYIDQPLAMYANLARTRTTWSEYEDWYVVRDFELNGSPLTGNPMDYSEDLYAWYAKHEHDEGVYLANVSRYEEATIDAYTEGSSDSKPEPFWYLAASPSYLRKVGIGLPGDVIERAEQGVRVYLLPESLDASEAEAMQRLLVASRGSVDSNIVTTFMKSPTYEFVPYDGSKELFTWSTDSGRPVTAGNFVIAVVTAENMVPFESESLVASGLENGYVKLDEQAASTLLGDDGEASLEGSLNARFVTVENYIDGIQKSLRDLFALFSIVLVLLVATVAVMVACIIDVVNRVSAREISVKYVLGFGTWELYRREILFVTISTMVGVTICALLRCKAGLLVGVALLLVSNLVIVLTSRQRTTAVVLETVSKEQ